MFIMTSNVFYNLLNDPLVVGIFAIVVIYIIQKRFGFYIFKIDDETTLGGYSGTFPGSTTHCNAENCVRCNKYSIILKAATNKLSHLEDGKSKQRMKSSLENEIPIKIECLNEPNPNVFLCNSLKAKTFWNSCQLDREFEQDVNRLEESCELIIKEFKNIYRENYLHCWKRNSTDTGSWDVFHLINQGVLVEDNMRLCPNTAGVVRELTTAMKKNVFGNILISVVKPSTVISPHYGPTNIRLRCHLGLVTNNECVLNVGPDQATWEHKQCLIFDDSFLHSVEHFGCTLESYEGNIKGETNGTPRKKSPRSMLESNQGDHDGDIVGNLLGKGDRAVLIVDLWHPELSEQERDVLNYMFSPVVDDQGK